MKRSKSPVASRAASLDCRVGFTPARTRRLYEAGWLARHRDFRGERIGAALLFDAIKTVAEAPIGAHALFADAIDDDAAAFYESFGFMPLTSRARTLYLPVSTALPLLERPALS